MKGIVLKPFFPLAASTPLSSLELKKAKNSKNSFWEIGSYL